MAIHRRLRLESLEHRQLLAGDFDNHLTPNGEAKPSSQDDVTGGMRAAEVRIQFDPEKVSPQPTDFLPGPAWQGKGAIVTNVDSTEGTVTAFLFSIDPIPPNSGDLIDIRLPIGPVQPNESIPAFAIESIKVDEGQQEIDPQEHRIDPVISEEIKRQVQARTETASSQWEDNPSTLDTKPLEIAVDAEPMRPDVPSNHAIDSTSDTPYSSAPVSPTTGINDSGKLTPAAVDEVYGPIFPSGLLDLSTNSVAEIEWPSSAGPSITDACTWLDFLSLGDSEKETSRAIRLSGARDDWSELDRLGYRKV